jgi:hypothetical protein
MVLHQATVEGISSPLEPSVIKVGLIIGTPIAQADGCVVRQGYRHLKLIQLRTAPVAVGWLCV